MTTRVYRWNGYWVSRAEAEGIPVEHLHYTRQAAEFGVVFAAQDLQRQLGAIHEAQRRVAGGGSMTINFIFRRRSRKELEAEIANLERENELLFETNNGLCDQLSYLMLPLPGEAHEQTERVLN